MNSFWIQRDGEGPKAEHQGSDGHRLLAGKKAIPPELRLRHGRLECADGQAAKYLRSLRLSLTVNNLATICSYSGLTPMINSSTVNSTLGVDDKRSYPLAPHLYDGIKCQLLNRKPWKRQASIYCWYAASPAALSSCGQISGKRIRRTTIRRRSGQHTTLSILMMWLRSTTTSAATATARDCRAPAAASMI